MSARKGVSSAGSSPAKPTNYMENNIKVGDFFEDCAYEPVLCTVRDEETDTFLGISLVSGNVKSCSIKHCGARLLTVEEAINLRLNGPDESTKEWYKKNSPSRIWWK